MSSIVASPNVGPTAAIGSHITTTPGSGVSSVPSSPATPIQHRLMLKTHAIDTWSLREQLGLASAVLRSGDQNWVSVSRQMKPFAEEGRPSDWFSQKNCALQYKLLLEKVPETPRRKRGAGTDKEYGHRGGGGDGIADVPETPGEAIVKRLTTERIQELQKITGRERSEIYTVQNQVDLLDNEDITEEQLDELEAQCEEEDRIEAERVAAYEAWLKDREEKKQAIQAALKAHSAKVPLKGAAALAVQQSGARRASSQSQGESSGTSDVDSPAPATSHSHHIEANQPMAVSKTPMSESTSPLLSSLLQTPSSVQSINILLSGDSMHTSSLSTGRTSESYSSPIVVVDSPNQPYTQTLTAEEGQDVSRKYSDETGLVAGVTPLSIQTKGKSLKTTKAETQKEQHGDGFIIDEGGNSMAIEDASIITGHGTGENEKTPISNKSDADFDVVGREEESDTENTITSEKKRPVGRKMQRRKEGSVLEDDEQEERPILPPATTRPSRKSKKLGEMTTGESGLLAPEGTINEDNEVVSTTNTPSSSASSSRASSRETRTTAKGGSAAISAKKPPDDSAVDITDVLDDKGNMVVPQVPQTDTRRSSRRGGSSRTASRSSSPAGSVGIPDEDETDESEANEYTSISAAGHRQRDTLRRRRSDRSRTQKSKGEDIDSAPPSPAETSNISESSKDATANNTVENESDAEEAVYDGNWRKQIMTFISEFVKQLPRKADKILNPDTSAVIPLADSSNKQRSQNRTLYQDVIRQPMNLETLRKRVETGQILSNMEFKHDFTLMVVNAIMSSTDESELSSYAKVFYNEFVTQFEHHIASTAEKTRSGTFKRVSIPGAKSAKSRASDHTSTTTLPAKYSKGSEKEATEGDNSRSRKRTASTMDDAQSQQKTSNTATNTTKKRRR